MSTGWFIADWENREIVEGYSLRYGGIDDAMDALIPREPYHTWDHSPWLGVTIPRWVLATHLRQYDQLCKVADWLDAKPEGRVVMHLEDHDEEDRFYDFTKCEPRPGWRVQTYWGPTMEPWSR